MLQSRLPLAAARLQQRGAAMVEFAIIASLLLLLTLGGVELATAALGSRGTREAALAGATDWANRVLQSARASDALAVAVLYDICPPTARDDEPEGCDALRAAIAQALVDAAAFRAAAAADQALAAAHAASAQMLGAHAASASQATAEAASAAFYLARSLAAAASAASAAERAGQEAKVPTICGLADHAVLNPPSCNDEDCTDPDIGVEGLPVYAAAAPAEHCQPLPRNLPASEVEALDVPPSRRDVLLFNPHPLDVTACVPAGGTAPDGRCVNRLFNALPVLHSVWRSQYQLRCYTTSDWTQEQPCRAGAGAWLYRLPGRLQPGNGPDPDQAGQVFLAQVVSASHANPVLASQGRQEWVRAADALPVFSLQCASAAAASAGWQDCDHRDEAQALCWLDDRTPLACDVRLQARYRHLFYAILGTQLYDEKTVSPDLLPELDIGMLNNEGVAVGGLGSEVTSQGEPERRVYFKVPWKTFLGCAETQVRNLGTTVGAPTNATTTACN